MNFYRRIVLFSAFAAMSACGSGEGDETPTDAGMEIRPDAGAAPSPRTTACEDGPGDVFDERVRPLLEQERPSSCSKCHAAGVDLGAFVRGDPCSSMACLVEQDLVNLESPRNSPILAFISRGYEPKPNTGVTEEMVDAEYEGFLAWIEWSARCMDSSCDLEGGQCGPRPQTPLSSTGEEEEEEEEPYEPPPLGLEGYPCGGDHHVQAFLDWVFPSHGRCGHCHAQNGAIAGVGGAPLWIDAHETLPGAKRTIGNLYALGNINLETPAKSRVLLKPLNEDAGGIEHGGGAKFADREDDLYLAFLEWIEMQSHCSRTGEPPDTSFAVDKVKLHGAPE